MALVIQIVGLVNGEPSPFDGQYVKEYDAERLAPNVIGAHLVTTPNIAEAQRFPSLVEAQRLWAWSRGVRPHDGKPDRPLTAFTVSMDTVPS